MKKERRYSGRELVRDFWTLVLTIIVAIALSSALGNVGKIENGRRAGTQVTCAISTAVINGGRELIEESAKQSLPPRLAKFLQAHGYPSAADRQKGAELLGQQYNSRISQGIIAAVGLRGVNVIEPEGSPHAGEVNCRKVRELAHVH